MSSTKLTSQIDEEPLYSANMHSFNRRNLFLNSTTVKNRVYLTSLFLSFFFGLIHQTYAQAANVQEMQELVQRWIVLEQQESAIRTGWQREEQILRQRLQLMSEEKSQLKAIISDNANDTDTVTERRTNLLTLQNTVESDQVEMQQTILIAMGSIKSLHSQLPPPLAQAWQERLDSLEQETRNDNSSNSNIQLQALLEILSQLQDFQQRISLNEDTISFENGTKILVKQIYLGLAHAWYVSADGLTAGYGQARPEGWTWLNTPQVDPVVVQQAIDMLERNVNVEMVELPLILQKQPSIFEQPTQKVEEK